MGGMLQLGRFFATFGREDTSQVRIGASENFLQGRIIVRATYSYDREYALVFLDFVTF